jgi:hypothetical protein
LQDAHARMLADAEREIIKASHHVGRRQSSESRALAGLSRFTLREKLKQLGLHPHPTEAARNRRLKSRSLVITRWYVTSPPHSSRAHEFPATGSAAQRLTLPRRMEPLYYWKAAM